jgi:alpha-mannosidase
VAKPQDVISTLGCRETVYFSTLPGSDELGQWLLLRVKNQSARMYPARAVVRAGGMKTTTHLDILPGNREYRCFAPKLWPDHPPQKQAKIRLEFSEGNCFAVCGVGSYRPWTLYLLSDTCSDYTWTYSTELRYKADDVALTEAELGALDATISDQPANRNRYNFVVANEVKFYEEAHSDSDTARLFQAIREGYFSVSPFPNMSLSCAQGLEELIRQFYMARKWEKQYGIPMRYANHQETPTITWALASVLAGCGIPYLVKGLLPFDAPWAQRLAEPPIFLWEGPDGSRIRYRRYNHHYNEGQFILRDIKNINNSLERRLIPEYESYGSSYPFDFVGLVGCYGDLSSQTAAMAGIKASHIAAYNNQGWEYPRFVNASHQLFWEEVERRVDRGADLPIVRGDYGTGWEVWLATLADLFADWRRAQERGPNADRVHAVAGRIDQEWMKRRQVELSRGWVALINLADHAWNGAEEENRKLNLSLRRRWADQANSCFDRVAQEGLQLLAARISKDKGDAVCLVMNMQGWDRTDVVRIPVDSLPPAFQDEQIVVVGSDGEAIPTQIGTEQGRSHFYFEAGDVPSLGYRTYRVQSRKIGHDGPRIKTNGIENRYYRIELDPKNGAVRSLYCKALDRQMLSPNQKYGLHRWIYRLNDQDQPIEEVKIRAGNTGPVFAELLIESRCSQVQVETALRLYNSLDRIEFRNHVHKIPTTGKEQLHFLFPVDIPNCRYRFEAPGAIITPGEVGSGGEQLPGSGQAYTAIRHSSDIFNDLCGMTLSQADSGFVLFGHRTEFEDPCEPDRKSSALIALALGNTVNYAEVTRDQAGHDSFTFRYYLRFYRHYAPESSLRFGWESSNPFSSMIVPRERGQFTAPESAELLPADKHSFLTVSEEKIVLVNTKVSEEHPDDGLIVRLWNLAEDSASATVKVSSLWPLKSVQATDLLERQRDSLPVKDNSFSIIMPGRGFATALIRFLS